MNSPRSDWLMAYPGTSRSHSSLSLGFSLRFCITKMFSRLCAGALRNTAGTGAARTSSIFHGTRSGAVLYLLEFFLGTHSPDDLGSGPFCVFKGFCVARC
jgi:hypothetical protein